MPGMEDSIRAERRRARSALFWLVLIQIIFLVIFENVCFFKNPKQKKTEENKIQGKKLKDIAQPLGLLILT